jgi:hypothetical protein
MLQACSLPSLLGLEAKCIEDAGYMVESYDDLDNMNRLAIDYWSAGAEVLRRLSSADVD